MISSWAVSSIALEILAGGTNVPSPSKLSCLYVLLDSDISQSRYSSIRNLRERFDYGDPCHAIKQGAKKVLGKNVQPSFCFRDELLASSVFPSNIHFCTRSVTITVAKRGGDDGTEYTRKMGGWVNIMDQKEKKNLGNSIPFSYLSTAERPNGPFFFGLYHRRCPPGSSSLPLLKFGSPEPTHILYVFFFSFRVPLCLPFHTYLSIPSSCCCLALYGFIFLVCQIPPPPLRGGGGDKTTYPYS